MKLGLLQRTLGFGGATANNRSALPAPENSVRDKESGGRVSASTLVDARGKFGREPAAKSAPTCLWLYERRGHRLRLTPGEKQHGVRFGVSRSLNEPAGRREPVPAKRALTAMLYPFCSDTPVFAEAPTVDPGVRSKGGGYCIHPGIITKFA